MPVNHVRRYRLSLALSSWLTFGIAFTFYILTLDPEASYWDCPEYVTAASGLEIGHPPGNPIWMLAMRAVTIGFPPHLHAFVINLCSALLMAFASFFLCRVIFLPVRIFFQNSFIGNKELRGKVPDITAFLISTGASLCFALCDSAWFSAVEAEVYAMSAFLTALSLWIMTLWWHEKSKAKETRLMVVLAYLTGISLGVHQLNLLLIPVFLLIILYKKYPRKVNPAIVILAVVGSIAIIGFILLAFIPGVLFGAESFELLAVNSLDLPYNSGVLIFLILLFILIIIGLYFSYHPPSILPSSSYLASIVWCFAFLLLGLSSFGMIMIRSKSSPMMNEGTPDNIFALSSYILREQYPSSSLLYGETPYSRPMFEETFRNGKPIYSKFILEKGKGIYKPVVNGASLHHRSGMLSHEDSSANKKVLEKQKGYLLSDYKFSQKLTPELNMWFPRMTSRNIHDRTAYVDWGGMTEDQMLYIPISETVDSSGEYQPRMNEWGNRVPVYSYRPTYYQNLKYFVSYQAYYMYFRYLFWNFIGRQNDFHSNGEIEHGNFITGIPVIDDLLIGETQYMPPEIWKENKGRNRYFGIPFAIGVLGILWLLVKGRKERRYLTIIVVLFIMTGIAIVVYLNQSPGEPRERDYTFIGNYMAFAMWIGAGMTSISNGLLRLRGKGFALFISGLISLGIPALMAAENFDDHDRRGRYQPSFYASSLLDFELPAIIFSQGDNSSFPLWYASEVLGMGESHSPVDITYLSLPDYVINLKKQGKKGVSSIAESPELLYGKYLLTKIPHDSVSKTMKIEEALEKLYTSEKPEWPTSQLIISDTSKDSNVINLHDFSKGSSFLSFRHLMLIDLLAANTASFDAEEKDSGKVLFFPSMIDFSFYKPLDPFLKPALFGKIYAPMLTDSMANETLKKSVVRELDKLGMQDISSHYTDPVISDRSVRYRGELIIAANQLLNIGDTLLPIKIIESIDTHYPYSSLLPGTFTIADSTYYEGKEYLRLLDRLYTLTDNAGFKESYDSLDSLMNSRRSQWINYYRSLSPAQRKTLSNRSLRLLK